MRISSRTRITTNMSEINITPLVDVMLVLLIIFMVAAPMMQSGITVNLPTAETKSNPSSGGLVLTVTKDRYIYMENQNINIFLLESRLKNYFMSKKKKIVFLKADKDVSYGYIISVMDVIKKAGIETVGMIVDKKDK
ncbi:MAG: biopolymer transporter ExbD [Candidatus Aminicenantes bacterium]|nr:biopolymer transporter ExbD [Candidatus Aminicenantes bacterium]MCK5005156.1 biopolymer transporter ExbD [Candidatus Aminicenantes bacterium]